MNLSFELFKDIRNSGRAPMVLKRRDMSGCSIPNLNTCRFGVGIVLL